MPLVRFRLVGSDVQADAMMTALHELDHVDRVEEVADQMHDRDDTSSNGSSEARGADFHCIEARATNTRGAEQIRDVVRTTAHELSAAVEFVERF